MFYAFAGLAQSVEQLICNQWVGGSNPSSGTIIFRKSKLKEIEPKISTGKNMKYHVLLHSSAVFKYF